MGKYFTVEVLPTVTASKQALGAFADGDLLFDWMAFDVPKGASKLIKAAAVVKSADGTINSQALSLFFAKTINSTAPGSLGVIHATALGVGYFNHIIGGCYGEETGDILTGLDFVTYQNFDSNRSYANPGLVLQGEAESGTNVGYDKLYLGGISIDGTPSFASTVQCDGIQATSQNILTVKTTPATRVFDKGDVLHDEDDRLIGTVKSVDSATQMTMEENLANATVDNKDLYCLNPYRILLSFER